MPDDALPQPWPAPLPGTVRYRRAYRDALGRPLSGTVTFTGLAGATTVGVLVPATPVRVALVDGALDVALLPDTYSLSASLRTVDDERTNVRDEITLTAR